MFDRTGELQGTAIEGVGSLADRTGLITGDGRKIGTKELELV